MSLTKNVDGEQVECSLEEEAEILARWTEATRARTEEELAAERDIRINLQWDERFTKFLFLVYYNQEKRLRVLEGKLEITPQQYFDKLYLQAQRLDLDLTV